MKFAIVLVFSLVATSAFAATCPDSSTMIKSCKSTPKAGDEVMAGDVLDSIAICAKGKKTLFIGEKNGAEEVSVAKVDIRMGGTSYTVKQGDVSFSLAVVTATPFPVKEARFTVTLKTAGLSASSTYTCKK